MIVTRNWISTSTKFIVIACIILLVLRSVLHYGELGFFEFILFNLFPNWLLLLLPISILIYRIIKKRIKLSVITDSAMILLTFYTIYFVMTPDNLDQMDWNRNYYKRQEIVRLAKEKKLANVYGSIYKIPHSLHLFPYFKSREINIQYNADETLTITFFTDRGLLDHYSGFIYSNNKEMVESLDEKVKEGGNDYKKEMNWYFIHD